MADAATETGDAPEPDHASPGRPSAETTSLPSATAAPFGDFDDDLSPLPFGGLYQAETPVSPGMHPSPTGAPPASQAGVPGTSVPDAAAAAPAPIAPAPSAISPQNTGDKPALEALPIKGRARGDGPPGAIPVTKRPASDQPPVAKSGPPVSPAASPRPPATGPSQPPPAAGPFGPASEPAEPLHGPAGHGAGGLVPLSTGARRVDITGAPAGGAETAAPAISSAGRTWYCRFCGMQSQSADQCSWCHHDLKSLPPSGGKPLHVVTAKGHAPRRGGGAVAPAPPGPKSAPGSGRSVRTEVRTGNGATAPAPPANLNGAGRPIIGTFEAGKSKYYPDKVFDPVSQSHYDADSGRVEPELPDAKIVTEETSDLRQLAIFSVAFAVVLLAAGIVTSLAPQSYLITLGVGAFLAGLLLPVLRVAPFLADDSTDLPIALALTLICGPFVGAMFYGVLWIIRGDANPAVVGIFLSYLLLRITVDLSTGRSLIELFSRMLPQLDVASVAASWMPLAGLLGWLCADPFKKPDE